MLVQYLSEAQLDAGVRVAARRVRAHPLGAGRPAHALPVRARRLVRLVLLAASGEDFKLKVNKK